MPKPMLGITGYPCSGMHAIADLLCEQDWYKGLADISAMARHAARPLKRSTARPDLFAAYKEFGFGYFLGKINIMAKSYGQELIVVPLVDIQLLEALRTNYPLRLLRVSADISTRFGRRKWPRTKNEPSDFREFLEQEYQECTFLCTEETFKYADSEIFNDGNEFSPRPHFISEVERIAKQLLRP